MAVVEITDEQRRRFVTRQHRLAPQHRLDNPVAITRSVAALHATDPATVFLSIAARSNDVSVADIEDALYGGRLARVLGMRRTLFVVPPELLAAVQVSCSAKIAETQHRVLVKMLTDAGLGGADPDAHIRALKAEVVAALAEGGPMLGRELAQVVPGLRQKFVMGQGASETSAGLTTLLLSRMTMDGTLTRGRPTGSWRSSQFTYALAEPLVDPPELEVAATLVLGEYLRAFGPASPEDCFWWTGWTKTQTRRAAEALGVVEVRLSSGEGWALPETLDLLVDLGVSGSDGPSVALLPSLDGSTMGWRDRDWYLADRAGPLFDARGNAGPTVWCDGEAIGGWGQREGGEVVNRLLVDRGREINELVEAEAARIGQWLDGVVVTPRYRSVLEKELAATRGR